MEKNPLIVKRNRNNKAKGRGFENEIRDSWNANAFEAERCFMSNGRARGYAPGVDIVVKHPEHPSFELLLQAKRKKSMADYMKPDKEVHAQIVREDGSKKAWAIVPLEHYIQLVNDSLHAN